MPRGRKSRYHELRIYELGNLSINWAIDEWEDLSRSMKVDILKALGPKFIAQEVKHSGEVVILADKVKDARIRISNELGEAFTTRN